VASLGDDHGARIRYQVGEELGVPRVDDVVGAALNDERRCRDRADAVVCVERRAGVRLRLLVG